MNTVIMNGYQRISKAKAHKLYDLGYTIHLTPCKFVPGFDHMFHMNIDIQKDQYPDALDFEKAFDSRVNAYSFYNCGIYETGYYPAFYIEVETK